MAMGKGFSTFFEKYTSIIAFDVETSGLDPYFDQIIEIGAQKLFQKDGGFFTEPLHYYVKLYDGHRIDKNAAAVNRITESMLEKDGVSIEEAISSFKRLIDGNALLIAHNANFDMLFATVAALKIDERNFFQSLDVIDTLTIFKDRAPYPHKLSDAIIYYHLENRVENNHTALGDTLALLHVVGAMAIEKDDLLQYVNLFGYNPKYPPQYKLISIDYCAQPYNSTLPLYQKAHKFDVCQTKNTTIPTGRVPLTDSVIMQEVAVPQTFYRGIEYAQLKRVRNLHFLKNKKVFQANVIGSFTYNTEFGVTEGGVVTWYQCNCQAFETYPKACKHIVALAKVVQQHWLDYFSMPDDGKNSLRHQSAVDKPKASEPITGNFTPPFNADYWESHEMNLGPPEAWCSKEEFPLLQPSPNMQAEDAPDYDPYPDPCYADNEVPEDYYDDYDREVDTRMDDNFYIGDGDDW